ncbi:MAG: hypothetical protein GF398_01450 [Chitinivibrionales bacterium]|nr:hypothetical protein [Chitinivibrionales bacterium]
MGRTLLHTVISLVLLLQGAFAGDKLFVFYPTPARPQTIQKELARSCPDFEVTVFGRYKDFVLRIKRESPAAIIAHPLIVDSCRGYRTEKKGLYAKKTNESFVLVSLGNPVNTDSLRALTIGVIDFLGRNGMQSFVTQFFSNQPRIKRVTKLEDLLPLLSFNMVNAILVQERFVVYLKSISKRQFSVVALPESQTGILSIATRKSTILDQACKAFGENKKLNTMLGVDSWQ